jgi:predicted P-loop ATPase
MSIAEPESPPAEYLLTEPPVSPEGAKERRKEPQGAEYVEFAAAHNYRFRLCELDDSLWVNNERMTDPLDAEIKTLLRDNGYPKVNVAADAFLAHARKESFHPVIDFLQSLKWDGKDHIAEMAGYVTDKHNNFPLVLKKWLLGAVARPMTGGKQNRVLVLEGSQGLGKSHLARWIASPLETYFSEAMPDPDNKDSRLALATTWIWEIKELGSVTRRADRESLKAWLTLESISERMPFGKYPIYKPAMTSFIATVNDEGGFFNDPTGSRRYMTVALKSIDWDYSKKVDIRQVWAQAMALYLKGEDWNLTPEEQKLIAAVNDEYEFSLPSHDWLDRYIEICPDAFVESESIRQAMAAAGDFGRDAHLAREIAGWMKKHGYEAGKEYVDVKTVDGAGMAQTTKKQVRGFRGARIARKFVPAYQEEP